MVWEPGIWQETAAGYGRAQGLPTRTGVHCVLGAKLGAVWSVLYVGRATCIFAPAFSCPETICLLEDKLAGMQWRWDQVVAGTN